MPEFDIPQEMPAQLEIDTSWLNCLLLASTLMQAMRAKAEDQHQEENAFKALQAVATTSSENYKDDPAYEQYRKTHSDVSDREREFLRMLVHFQTLGLQIFERKQSHIQQLEEQLKSQKDLNTALETSLQNEAVLQQKLQDMGKRLHQAQTECWEHQQAKEVEI